MERLKHILSSRQFDLGFLINLYKDALAIEELLKTWEGRRLLLEVAPGSRMGGFFWQVSSRTLETSNAGISIIGGNGFNERGVRVLRDGKEDWELAFSSAVKGAYLEDEFLAWSFCHDLLVLRTHRPFMPHEAAAVVDDFADEFDSEVHVINAGDSTNEHPTQTLNDIYTMLRALNFTLENDHAKLKNYSIAFVNDGHNSRTIHSLALKAGIDFGMTLGFITPPGLEMPRNLLDELEGAGVKFWQDTKFQHADFYYVTRLQKEYGVQLLYPEKMDEYINYFRVTQQVARENDVRFVMHPYPRSKEYEELPRRNPGDQSTWGVSLDKTPKALYVKQMRYSAPIKAALFKYLLNPQLDFKKLKEEKLVREILSQCVSCHRVEYQELGWTERAPKCGYIRTLTHIFCPNCRPAH